MKHEVAIYHFNSLIHSYSQDTGNVPKVDETLTYKGVDYRIVSVHHDRSEAVTSHRINVVEAKEKRR